MKYFKAAIDTLRNGQVNFVVIGGIAMGAHGSAYVTLDVDVCYERSRENIRRLAAAVAPLHPRLRNAPADLPFRFDEETIRRGLNFTLTTDLGALDLLGEVSGLGFYADVLAASVEARLFEGPCRVLSIDGLIKSKRAAGRPKDIAAVAELEALREMQNTPLPPSER